MTLTMADDAINIDSSESVVLSYVILDVNICKISAGPEVSIHRDLSPEISYLEDCS